ncbi:MAG: radical SAM protein [Candidatus Omnitrophica bacterium]|nr:radical SAM protein [Candidatus Omnitrophota bacterium]
MKVLFLLTTVGCKVHAHHPTGFLSAVLKQGGHQTDYIELERMDLRLLDAKIEAYQPGILAVSTVMQQFGHVQTCINHVKAKYPHIKIVLGGTHPILKPDCIEEIEGLDALCVSEGEMPLLQYVNAIEGGRDPYTIPSMRFRVDGQILATPNTYAVTEQDLAVLPMQDRMVFPRFRDADRSQPLPFRPRVLWGRGCPFACSYCAVPSIKKAMRGAMTASNAKWVRYPPVERAIEEVEHMLDRWKFRTYVIDDDVLTTHKDWVLKLASKYPERLKRSVTFECNLRVETIDRETMRALKDMGCVLLKFGLENGAYEMRKKILRRPITDEQIKQVFSWAHEVGIPAHTFNMVGVPGETRETIWKTITLNRAIRPARVQISIFFPYYGTPLGDEARAKQLVVTETASYFSGASVKLDTISSREIERYADWFKFLVYAAYDRKLAWAELRQKGRRLVNNVKGELKARIPLLKQVALARRRLQVETLGADGEQPEVLEQYDIEDVDQNVMDLNESAEISPEHGVEHPVLDASSAVQIERPSQSKGTKPA